MARYHKKRKPYKRQIHFGVLFVALLCVGTAGAFSYGHYVRANTPPPVINTDNVEPNFHVKTLVTQFFEDNNAAEMIPIIRCESGFRQFDDDGAPLQNHEGSSALGVAQIMASKHPDPKIIYRYNKRNDTDFTIDDFDITTLEGNMGYALILYKMNGVKDWECSKKFRW